MRAFMPAARSRPDCACRRSAEVRRPRRPVLAMLVPVALLSLAACTVGLESPQYRGARPDGRQLRPLGVEPVYLDSGPTRLGRDELFQYGCKTPEPLVCRCTGRITACDCRCPLPSGQSRR